MAVDLLLQILLEIHDRVDRLLHRYRYRYRYHGYDRYGYNRYGYNRYGYDRYGYDGYGYDRYGYDRYGYDRYGYDRYGFHRYRFRFRFLLQNFNKVESKHNEMEKERFHNSGARMQKMHLLKNYDILKEELNWPDIIAIADSLYTDGHIQWHEWQNILDRSQPRRKAIDILLMIVLGNASSVSAFMKIMESKSTLSYITERINIMQTLPIAMENEKENDVDLQKKDAIVLQHSLEPLNDTAVADRDDSSTARMHKMQLLKNYDMLKEELNWPDIIAIADSLYTDGHLQWHELVKILDRSQPRRKAIDILLKVVLGNASSVTAFMKIIESNSTLSYIAERINMSQISAEEMEDLDNPPAQRPMRIHHDQKESASDALEKFASGLMIGTVRQKLGNNARKYLDLEFKEAFWGSFGLMFSFQSGKPSQKLKQPFAEGPDDFAEINVQCVF